MSIYIHYWYKKIININHIPFNPTPLIFSFFFFCTLWCLSQTRKKYILPQKKPVVALP